MEIVSQSSISMPEAIKANLARDADKQEGSSFLLDRLNSIGRHVLRDQLTQFTPITVMLSPKDETFDFQGFEDTTFVDSRNETSTPVIPGREKMVVLHPVQLIAFASDKLNPEKFAEIIDQWEKASLNRKNAYDEKTGMILNRTFKNPHLLLTLKIQDIQLTVPAFLAYPDKPDDMPDLNSISLSEGLINFLKTKGVDLYATSQQATITDFSVPRMPSSTTDYTA